MKFSFALVSSLTVLSLAVSAAPLDATTPALNSSVSSTPSPTSSIVDAMHGAKATASISIIGVETPSSGSSTLKYASISIIVPAVIAAMTLA
ncbi:hypothetical protein K501DRAFT_287786 [Backusella circina FSU 941]|nr:hypothetical protein K501DRAFT_287786 [Backusella circina FSU 941]